MKFLTVTYLVLRWFFPKDCITFQSDIRYFSFNNDKRKKKPNSPKTRFKRADSRILTGNYIRYGKEVNAMMSVILELH